MENNKIKSEKWAAKIYFVVGPDKDKNKAFMDALCRYLLYIEDIHAYEVEYPEEGLWPEHQACLVQDYLDRMNIKRAGKENFCMIIVTNSEYLVRASQVIVKEMGFASNAEADAKAPFACFCVSEGKGSGMYDIFQDAYSLQYRADGKFVNEFCSGFYDVASDLAYQLM